MPLAVDLQTTLIANVVANLKDEVNHPDVDVFKDHVYPAAVPMAGFAQAPYLIVTVGETEDVDPDAGGVDYPAVELVVWVVAQEWADEFDPAVLIGTAVIERSGTLCKAVRRALVRAQPYRGAPYNAAPYTEAAGVLTCIHVRTGPFEEIPIRESQDDEDPSPVGMVLARPMTFRYTYVEA